MATPRLTPAPASPMTPGVRGWRTCQIWRPVRASRANTSFGRGHVHHAVDHERRRAEVARAGHGERPSEPQAGDVAWRDLRQARVAIAGNIAVVGGPVARARRKWGRRAAERRHRPAPNRLDRSRFRALHRGQRAVVAQHVHVARALGEDQSFEEGAVAEDGAHARPRRRRLCLVREGAHVPATHVDVAGGQRHGGMPPPGMPSRITRAISAAAGGPRPESSRCPGRVPRRVRHCRGRARSGPQRAARRGSRPVARRRRAIVRSGQRRRGSGRRQEGRMAHRWRQSTRSGRRRLDALTFFVARARVRPSTC